MDFHGINMQGMFYIEHQQDLPLFNQERDYRRFIFVPDGGTPYLWYGSHDRWIKLGLHKNILEVKFGGTGVDFIPDNCLIVGRGLNPVDFIEPINENDVLTVNNGKWSSMPVQSSITCGNKGDIQSHNGTNPDTFEFGPLHNGKVIVSNESRPCGMEWVDFFNSSICKTGINNFAGLGDEREIINPFAPNIPRFFTVIPSPPSPSHDQIGFIGEYWTRCTNSHLYVGNTGSAVLPFRWLSVL